MKQDHIDYSRIAKAQLYYKAVGYVNVDTPWMVSQPAVLATLPPGAKIIESNLGSLVGSGEQGFIECMLDGTMTPGKYQTTTPCFRDEPAYTDLTRRSFMKTELIWYMPENESESFLTVINDALQCFFAISDVEMFDVVQTDEGYDINLGSIELGSYGIRKMNDHTWIYGTGLAEPRFSIAARSASALGSNDEGGDPSDTTISTCEQ